MARFKDWQEEQTERWLFEEKAEDRAMLVISVICFVVWFFDVFIWRA